MGRGTGRLREHSVPGKENTVFLESLCKVNPSAPTRIDGIDENEQLHLQSLDPILRIWSSFLVIAPRIWISWCQTQCTLVVDHSWHSFWPGFSMTLTTWVCNFSFLHASAGWDRLTTALKNSHPWIGGTIAMSRPVTRVHVIKPRLGCQSWFLICIYA